MVIYYTYKYRVALEYENCGLTRWGKE